MEGTKVRAAFVGRGPELERVSAALTQTLHGDGVTVLCGGEAGIGKTRFVQEVAGRARDDGCAVLIGGCVEMGPAGLPYGPFAEALRGAVGTGYLDPSHLHPAAIDQLAILIPDIRPDDDSRVEADLAGLGQVRLFEAILTAVEEVRRARPVMLVIEDIHWADRSTLDLMTFLVRNVEASGVMLFVTIRNDELDRDDPLHAVLAELGRRPSVDRFDLRPLDLQETTDQLASIMESPPDPEIAQRIHRRSDGNPFFIEQLAWAHADGESSTVPASLRDILLTQLSRQPRGVQDLLSAASIAGPLADDNLLASILGRDPDDILEPLRLAVRAGLLVRTPTGEGESYGFRHALLAEATEADLLEGERRRLHARCADALARRRPTDAASLVPWAVRLAYHRDRSGDIDAAVAASIEAATLTEAVAAHADAMAQYERAIRLLPSIGGAAHWGDWDASELFARAAACSAVIGEVATAAAYTREAIHRLPVDADPWRRGHLSLVLSEHLWIAGDPGFIDALSEAERVIPREPPTAGRAAALIAVAFYQQYRGDVTAARQALDESLATAIAADAAREESLARILLVAILMEAGAVDEGYVQLDEAVAALRRTAPRPDTSVAYMNIASIAAWVGRHELALTVCRDGLDLARRFGFETYYGGGLAATGAETLLSLGRLCEAASMLETVAVTPVGSYSDTLRRLASALVWTHLGDLERAGDELRAAHAWPAGGDVALHRWIGVVEAEWRLERGPTDAVEAVVSEALALPPSHVPDLDYQATLIWLAVRAMADIAEHARAARDVDAVRRAVATGDAYAELARTHRGDLGARDVLSPMCGRAGAYLAMAIGESTRLHDRPDPTTWAAAAEAADGHGIVLRPIYARIRQAEACLTLGRDARSDAAGLLAAAHAGATATGSRPLIDMSEGIARRARIDLDHVKGAARSVSAERGPATAGPADPYGLTPREVEILGLLAVGLTNRQIGERLFISPKTAGVHVSNILGKLELDSRIQAATLAHRLGIATVLTD
jgi:DNA-binding NarL/FixJ family response regulator